MRRKAKMVVDESSLKTYANKVFRHLTPKRYEVHENTFSNFVPGNQITLFNINNSVQFQTQLIFTAFNPQMLYNFINFYSFRYHIGGLRRTHCENVAK
jgi:hypothetical protein